MTRETKIGLLVAGSFLCLVCVVVASKWKRGDDSSEEQTIKVAAVKDAPKKKESEQEKAEEPKTPLLTVPTVPGEFRAVEAPKIDIPAPKIEFPLPKAETPPGGIQLPMEFQLPTPKDGDVKPKEGEPKPLIVMPPEVKPVVKDPADGGFQIPPKPLQVVEEKKPLIPELPAVPAPKPFTEKEQPSFPKELTIPAPKEVVTLPLPKDMVPSLPMPPAPKETPSLSVPVPLPKDPPTTPPTPIEGTPIPKIPPKDLPTVPLTVGPMPVVRDVSTDPYVCVVGDASFAALSRRFYGSEKYADALLAYNREHARWIKNGTALLSNPPALQPGQHVERPPVSILERSYRAWIAEPAAPKVTITPPIGIGTPGVATVGNPPSAGKGGTYRVQNPNGESVFDVAERTLGNRSLWPEIWRVNQSNPAVRPPAPIPFGTELRLP